MKLAISAKMDNEKILGEGLCDFTHFAKVFQFKLMSTVTGKCFHDVNNNEQAKTYRQYA